jgi:hypothetical protein
MCGNAAVVGGTFGRWVQRVTVSETGSGVPGFASLSLSCHAEAWIKPSSVKVNASSQRYNRRSDSHSAKEILHNSKPRILEGVLDMDSSEPRSRTRNRTKAISSELLACFAHEGEFFLSQNFTPGETCVHHFEPETKKHSLMWHHPQCPRQKKIRKVSVSRYGHSLLGPWRSDSRACDAGRGDNSSAYIRTLKEPRKRFKWVWPHKDPTEILPSAWKCKAAHKFEDSGNHDKIWTVFLIHPTAPI